MLNITIWLRVALESRVVSDGYSGGFQRWPCENFGGDSHVKIL